MCLDLEADVVLVVEANDSGVVGEDADQPVEPQLLGRGEDGLLEEVVDRPPLELDLALQGLVRAVLAPGLGQGFQLTVGRVAVEPGEVPLDGPHLGQVERELPRPAHLQERLVIHRAERHGEQPKLVMPPLAQMVERQAAKGRLLDGLVGQHALDQTRQLLGRPVDLVAANGSHSLHGEAELAQQRACAFGFGIGHAGPGQYVDDRPVRHGGRRNGTDLERLDHRIGQHLPGRSIDVFLAERSFDQKAATGRDRPGARNRGLGRFDRQSLSNQVGITRGGMNFKVPEHAWPSWFKD